MRRAIVLALALVAGPVAAQQSGPVVIAAHLAPLFPALPSTAAHVIFRDGAGIIDTRGNAWAQIGTVPQIGRTANAPAGAGNAFSDGNWYGLGTGNDPLDFAGDWFACFVFLAAGSFVNNPVLYSNGVFASSGHAAYFSNAGNWRMNNWSGTSQEAITTNVAVAGVNVGCVGRAGTTIYAKLNLGTTRSAASVSVVPGTARVARLGRYEATGQAYAGGLYEAGWWATAWDEATVAAIMQRVHDRLAITAW